MTRQAYQTLLVAALAPLIVSPQTTYAAAGPVARIAIFNPVLGEVLSAAPAGNAKNSAADGALALDVHFAVIGPPDEIAQVVAVCFEIVVGYNFSIVPSSSGLPYCVNAHPGRHDMATISGLAAGQHTLLAEMRWKTGSAAPARDVGLTRTAFTLTSLVERRFGYTSEERSSFFLATARAGGGESSARVLAFVGSELMFRSTGSSNYGSNYPGVWFPTAGICPRSFLPRSGHSGGSFVDMLRSSASSSRRLHRSLVDPNMLFDKRFAMQYQQRTSVSHPPLEYTSCACLLYSSENLCCSTQVSCRRTPTGRPRCDQC